MWAVRSGHRESVARYVLGEIALANGHTLEALDNLSQSVMLDPRDLKARSMLALAERLGGRLEVAQQHIDAVVQEMPIDYFARHEQYEIPRYSVTTGRPRSRGQNYGYSWHASLTRFSKSHLITRLPEDVVSREGFLKKRSGVHRHSPATGAAKRDFPMLHYTLGFLYDQDGDRDRARSEYSMGAKGDPAFVFPHRIEEIAVLRGALTANPQDGRAAYYLGNVLASKNRDEEALAAWRDCNQA